MTQSSDRVHGRGTKLRSMPLASFHCFTTSIQIRHEQWALWLCLPLLISRLTRQHMIEGFLLLCFSFSCCHVATLPSDKEQATAVAISVAGEPNQPRTQPCSKPWNFSKHSHHLGARNRAEKTRPKSVGDSRQAPPPASSAHRLTESAKARHPASPP